MKSIIITLFIISTIFNCVFGVNISQNKYSISVDKKHHDSESSQSGDSIFQSGNILITDPTSLDPTQFYEFTTDGVSVFNYTTFLTSNSSERCVPTDMGFLKSSTLLLLDSQQGVFESDSQGHVLGYWNNLKTNTKNKLGCSLSKMNVDTLNSKVYVSSSNINCDYNYENGIFVYTNDGNLDFIITNPNFNITTGIAGDSNGNIWVTDINSIFVFNSNGKLIKTFDPINANNRIAYNGIIISADGKDNIYISVPSYQGDMIIEINSSGELKNAIKLIGIFNGSVSGLPGSLALTKNHIYVEVPYASKKESPSSSDSSSSSGSSSSSEEEEEEDSSSTSKKIKADVVQSYNLDDGSFNKAWGGHSCNPKNMLCIPYSGFVIVP